jgi:hypothetical protein
MRSTEYGVSLLSIVISPKPQVLKCLYERWRNLKIHNASTRASPIPLYFVLQVLRHGRSVIAVSFSQIIIVVLLPTGCCSVYAPAGASTCNTGPDRSDAARTMSMVSAEFTGASTASKEGSAPP